MKIFGHVAGGYLVSRMVTKYMPIPDSERSKWLILGAVAGTIPDWDYLWYAWQKRGLAYSSDFRHHTWITHTFPFHWLIAGILYWIGGYQHSRTLQDGAKVIAAATTAHLLQDMVGSGDGIMLFYPFSKKHIGVGLMNLHGDEWNRAYMKSPYYGIELGIGAIAILTALVDVFRKLRGAKDKK
jgi:membrane-bound metal-dependent hydrolase YbcI (DUF457 family)